MKKALIFCLLSAMIVSLGSCGPSASSSKDPNKDSTSTTTTKVDPAKETGSIKVWLDDDTWAKAEIKGFNTKYPNVKVTYEKVGAVDAPAKIALDGPAGNGPDLFLVPHDSMGSIINDGLAEPLTDQYATEYKNLINKSALGTVENDGKYYGVPISTENLALFWNKDLYGATPPKTFDDIINFSKTYNDPSKNKYAMEWDPANAYVNFIFLSAAGMQIFGPNHTDYKSIGLDTAEAKKGVEFQNSLRQYYNVASADATKSGDDFKKGTVPITITGPWDIADLKKNKVNFGVTKLPTIDGKQPYAFSGNIIAVTSAYSKNKELAMLFNDYLVSNAGATIMYETEGKMTTLKDVSGIKGLSNDPYLMGMAQQTPYTVPMPNIPEMAQAWDAIKNLFQFSWDKKLSVPDAQKKAMETYKTELQAAGKSLN